LSEIGGALRDFRQMLTWRDVISVLTIALIASITWFSPPASARTDMAHLVLPANGATTSIDLNRFMERLTSDRNVTDPAQLIDIPSSEFEPVASTAGPGYTPRVIWYRLAFSLTAPQGNDISRAFIELGEPYLNEIRLTVIDDETRNVIWKNVVGDRIPNTKDSLISLRHLSEWPDLPSGHYWLMIGVRTNSAHVFHAKLYPEAELVSDTEEHNLVESSFLGVLLIGFGVYLTFGIISRDKSVLWYSGYVLSVFLFNLGTSGYAQILLKGIWPLASDLITGTGTAFALGASVAMWTHIVRLDHYNPVLFRVMMAFSILAMIGSVTAISDAYIYFTQIFFIPNVILLFTLLMYLIYVSYRERRLASNSFFFIALALPTLAANIHVLTLLGILPITAFTTKVYPLSSSIHLVMVAIAMAYRTQRLTYNWSDAHQTNARADQLAGEQRTFITMLSHEFRTPLAIIQRSAEILGLHLRNEPAPVHSRLATIRGNAGQLSGLVDAFLTKETLDSANFTTSLQPTNIDQLLHDLINRRNREIPDQKVSLKNIDFAIVDIDRILFERAIINLIDNARKYAPNAPVWVACNRSSNGFVYIRIIDAGPGIPVDDLTNVSNAFYRGRDAGVTQGVGLGLHITNRIVQSHNGSMSVSVGETSGTTVMIKIPYNREETVKASRQNFFGLAAPHVSRKKPRTHDDGGALS
tara:strand:+ start:447 stop:2537 length:2091 start_codon:yes stop_codon:yes gene_type:complete